MRTAIHVPRSDARRRRSARVARALTLATASISLMFGTLALAPAADAAAAPAAATTTARTSYGPPGCGISYSTSRSIRWKYVKASNDCSWGQRCIEIRTGIHNSLGWWDTRTSPGYWVNPGTTLTYRYGGGRSLIAVYYCD